MNIPWLEENTPLPLPETAQKTGSNLAGLVAAGGGLSVSRLCEAYRQGIFPWFSEGQPVLWWSPDPRMVLQTRHFKLHHSLRKTLRTFIEQPDCTLKIDSAFSQVIRHCAKATRKGQPGTWIVADVIDAYEALYAAGFAHSVETWRDGQLIGGLYCVSIGAAIFGESMFALETDASKIALAGLVAFARSHGSDWIDCQQNTKHLASLGAQEMPRQEFLKRVKQSTTDAGHEWQFKVSYWETILPSKSNL